MNKNSKTALIILAIVSFVFFFFIYQVSQTNKAVDPRELTDLKASKIYPKFKQLMMPAMTDHNGQAFDLNRFTNKWSFVFFGYTSCPDICPTTLAVFNQVYGQLPEKIKPDTQIVLMTVDPERDTVEKLEQYVPFFHQDFIGVTATVENMDFFARQLGAVFVKSPDKENPENYLMDHTVKVFLINPNGERFAIISPEHQAGVGHAFDGSAILDDYVRIRQAVK